MLTDKIFTDIKMDPELFGTSTKTETFIWPHNDTKIPLGSQNGKSPLTVMDSGKMLIQYAKEGDCNKVHELILKGAPFTSDWLGTSALHFAATNNDYNLCELLLRSGINKDAKTKVDRTPLHLAVYEGHEKIVELLLGAKCDIDPKDMLRMTPLHWAIEKHHKSIAQMLLKHGADPEAVSKFDKTALSLAIQTGQTDLIPDIEQAVERKLNTIEQVEKATDNIKFDLKEDQSETDSAVNSLNFCDDGKTDLDLSSVIAEKSAVTVHGEISEVIPKMESQEEITETMPILNSPDPSNIIDSNSNSNMEDDNIDYVEPIVQLQNLDEPKQLDESALQMLKNHGISMLKDTENTLLQSALQSGRKLVLTEAGKLVLNETRKRKFTEPSPTGNEFQTQLGHNSLEVIPKVEQKGVMHNIQTPIKTNKNVKIISMEAFRRMCAENNISPLKKIGKTSIHKITSKPPVLSQISQQTIHGTSVPKLRKLSPEAAMQLNLHKLKSKPVYEVTTNGHISHSESIEEDDELPPNIIEVSDNSMEEIIQQSPERSSSNKTCVIPKIRRISDAEMISRISNCRSTNYASSNDNLVQNFQRLPESNPASRSNKSLQQISFNSTNGNLLKVVNIKSSATRTTAPTLDIVELSRQLCDVRKQVEELQKRFELSQKQNEEYKLRIEALEKEREIERNNNENCI